MSAGSSPICLLVSIVNRDQGKYIKRFCEENSVHFSFRIHGDGTANSDLLQLLGLDGVEKNLICNLLPEHKAQVVMRSISQLMSMSNPGRGIAFTIPLSGINALAAREIHQLLPEDETQHRKAEELVEFSLIIAVYNAGYTDEVVACARAAGATGGTVLHARGITKEQCETYFGMSIQDEKEVITILSPTEQSRKIMEALNKQCGAKTDASALVLSVPVSHVAGLG